MRDGKRGRERAWGGRTTERGTCIETLRERCDEKYNDERCGLCACGQTGCGGVEGVARVAEGSGSRRLGSVSGRSQPH
jgi:hypothetical protein